MHYKIIDRQSSVLVFEDGEDVNYVASCQVFLYGDVGLMYGLNGRKFYELMAVKGAQIMAQLGVKMLEGYLTPAHARLMRIALNRIADVTEAHEGMMAGQVMVWVVITPKGSQHLLANRGADETLDIVKRRVI
jgi:hypothetical protein